MVAILFASASIDYWTVMRFFGSRGITAPPDAWKDQVFSRPCRFTCSICLSIRDLLGFVFVLAILCAPALLGHGARMAVVERIRYGQLIDGSNRPIDFGAYLLLAGRQHDVGLSA